MTLIFSQFSPDTIIIAADRRLTLPDNSPPHDVFSEDATKLVFYHGSMIFGFAGVARIGDVTPTHQWLAELLDYPVGTDITVVASEIAKRATEDFMRLPGRPRMLIIHGSGWSTTSGGVRVPMSILVSNAHDLQGTWLRKARTEFVACWDLLSFSERLWRYYVMMPPLPRMEMRLWQQRYPRAVASSQTIEESVSAIVSFIQETSLRRRSVGSDVLVGILPKDTDYACDVAPAFEHRIRTGTATFLTFNGPGSSGDFSNPTLVYEGRIMTNVRRGEERFKPKYDSDY